MKTLLSIIAAFALLVAFSMPVMADNATTGDNSPVAQDNDGSAVAQNGSLAIDGDVYTDNRTYDDDNNAVAIAWLGQVNAIEYVGDEIIDGSSGRIELNDSIDEFAGMANVNLNTGAMNNPINTCLSTFSPVFLSHATP